MARIIGNNTSGRETLSAGGGVPSRRAPFSHITIAGEGAGDVIIIDAADLFAKGNQVFQGVFAQSIGAAVQADATLVDGSVANNPDVYNAGMWTADTSLTATSGVVKLKLIGTAYRFTFAAKGLLYLAGV